MGIKCDGIIAQLWLLNSFVANTFANKTMCFDFLSFGKMCRNFQSQRWSFKNPINMEDIWNKPDNWCVINWRDHHIGICKGLTKPAKQLWGVKVQGKLWDIIQNGFESRYWPHCYFVFLSFQIYMTKYFQFQRLRFLLYIYNWHRSEYWFKWKDNSAPNVHFRFLNFVLRNQKLKKGKWQCGLNLDLLHLAWTVYSL